MPKGKQKNIEQQNQTATTNAIAAVSAVNPFQAQVNAQIQKSLDWKNGTGEFAGKPRNIMDAPGFSDATDVYGTSRNATELDRKGGGALNLADPASGAYADQMKTQNNLDFSNNRAEGLSSAVANMQENNLRQLNQSIDRDAAQKNAVAGFTMQNQQNYYQRPKKESIWKTILKTAIGGASTLAKGGM